MYVRPQPKGWQCGEKKMKNYALGIFLQAHGRLPQDDKEFAKFCLFGGKVWKN